MKNIEPIEFFFIAVLIISGVTLIFHAAYPIYGQPEFTIGVIASFLLVLFTSRPAARLLNVTIPVFPPKDTNKNKSGWHRRIAAIFYALVWWMLPATYWFITVIPRYRAIGPSAGIIPLLIVSWFFIGLYILWSNW